MDRKVIVVGVAAVLVVTALFALITYDRSQADDAPPFTGEWHLTYTEIAKMTDGHGRPLASATHCEISHHFIDPADKDVSIRFLEAGDHLFKGEFLNGDHSLEFHGSYRGHLFTISTDLLVVNEESFHMEGLYEDGKLSISTIRLNVATGSVVSASYALFVRDGAPAVTHLTDFVRYDFDPSTPVHSELHRSTDFTVPGADGKGTSITDVEFSFEKTYSMITLHDFSYVSEGEPVIGLQAIVSLGLAGDTCAAVGVVGGNFYKDGAHSSVIGNSLMVRDKLYIVHNIGNPIDLTMAEFEFNVDYNHGEHLPYPHFAKKYVGTVTYLSGGKAPVTQDVTKTVMQVDNTVFFHEVVDNVTISWIGDVYGDHVSFIVKVWDKAGQLSAVIHSNGDIVAVGTLFSPDGPSVVIYELSPVE